MELDARKTEDVSIFWDKLRKMLFLSLSEIAPRIVSAQTNNCLKVGAALVLTLGTERHTASMWGADGNLHKAYGGPTVRLSKLTIGGTIGRQ